MRRNHRDATKVWHNPDIHSSPRRGQQQPALPTTERTEDRKAAKQHRDALEALFSPRKEVKPSVEVRDKSTRERIVLAPPPQSDSRAVERQKLLSKLLLASGRPNISKAANEFLRAGHTFPLEQDVYLQLLEHVDEERVLQAIEALSKILVAELPKRRAVLESRLRRIEQFADEAETRDAAARLRRQVSGRMAVVTNGNSHASSPTDDVSEDADSSTRPPSSEAQ